MNNSRQQRDQYFVKMIMAENQKKEINNLRIDNEEKLGIKKNINIEAFEIKDVDSIINELKTDELKRQKAKKEKMSLITFSVILFILATIGLGCIVTLIHLIY